MPLSVPVEPTDAEQGRECDLNQQNPSRSRDLLGNTYGALLWKLSVIRESGHLMCVMGAKDLPKMLVKIVCFCHVIYFKKWIIK